MFRNINILYEHAPFFYFNTACAYCIKLNRTMSHHFNNYDNITFSYSKYHHVKNNRKSFLTGFSSF